MSSWPLRNTRIEGKPCGGPQREAKAVGGKDKGGWHAQPVAHDAA
jgi:hypothetical protein